MGIDFDQCAALRAHHESAAMQIDENATVVGLARHRRDDPGLHPGKRLLDDVDRITPFCGFNHRRHGEFGGGAHLLDRRSGRKIVLGSAASRLEEGYGFRAYEP